MDERERRKKGGGVMGRGSEQKRSQGMVGGKEERGCTDDWKGWNLKGEKGGGRKRATWGVEI